jgi:hypothetical protein
MATLVPGVLPGLFVLGPHSTAAKAAPAAAAAATETAAPAPTASPPPPPPSEPLPRGRLHAKEVVEPPPGAVFDDTVLVFKAFYNESVADSALEVRARAREPARGDAPRRRALPHALPHRLARPRARAPQTWRIRHLIIHFYLRDSKTEVDEVQVRVCVRPSALGAHARRRRRRACYARRRPPV